MMSIMRMIITEWSLMHSMITIWSVFNTNRNHGNENTQRVNRYWKQEETTSTVIQQTDSYYNLLPKHLIHEVHMEITANCIINKSLLLFLCFTLISEYHIIIPSTHHSYFQNQPSFDSTFFWSEHQWIRMNHFFSIQGSLHLCFLFLLLINNINSFLTSFCLASSFSFFTRANSASSKAFSSSLHWKNEIINTIHQTTHHLIHFHQSRQSHQNHH